MKTIEQKIEAIYSKIANKELSFGCNLIIYNPTGNAKYIELTDTGNGFTIMTATEGYSVLNHKDDLKEYEIIGHPVLISTVEYNLSNEDYIEVRRLISKEELIKPIEEWNDLAIEKTYEKVLHIGCKAI